MNDADQLAFRSAVASSMGKRLPFQSQVMLELDLVATAKTPPAIHTVAKNFLDLTYGSRSARGHLLRDDRQVRYLAVRYSAQPGATRPSVVLRATRMSLFREDVRLARDILYNQMDQSDDIDDNAIENLRDLEANRADIVARRGEDTFEALRQFDLNQVQGGWLLRTERLLHSAVLALLADDGKASDAIHLGGVKLPAAEPEELHRGWLCSAAVSLKLAPLPNKKGDSVAFQAEVTKALKDVRTAHPFLFPLATELAVFILLVPPADGSGIDLDNLALKVIPIVHTVLEPPGRGRNVNLARVRDPMAKSHLEAREKASRGIPSNHVTRYEVLALPRTSGDPAVGSVRLVLCDGARGLTLAGAVESLIAEWEAANAD